QPRANMPTPTTDMAYPLSLGQETLAAAQLLLRLLAFRDVYDDGREKRRRASSRRDQGTAYVCPDYIAVLASVAFLDSIISSLPFSGLCPNRFGVGTVLFLGHFQSGESLELLL